MSQSAAVNVRVATETAPSVGSLVATGMVTSAVGALPSTTVNVAVPPDSVVTSPEIGATSTLTAAAGAAPPASRITSASTDRSEGAPKSNDDTQSLPWGGDGRGTTR